MTDLEARARLSSILDVLDHEAEALQTLEDRRLDDVLRAIVSLRTEIVATLGELDKRLPSNGG
jgi:hypothetical protein